MRLKTARVKRSSSEEKAGEGKRTPVEVRRGGVEMSLRRKRA